MNGCKSTYLRHVAAEHQTCAHAHEQVDEQKPEPQGSEHRAPPAAAIALPSVARSGRAGRRSAAVLRQERLAQQPNFARRHQRPRAERQQQEPEVQDAGAEQHVPLVYRIGRDEGVAQRIFVYVCWMKPSGGCTELSAQPSGSVSCSTTE